MRRFTVILAAAALMVAMMIFAGPVFAGPASSPSPCKRNGSNCCGGIETALKHHQPPPNPGMPTPPADVPPFGLC
jgi:hypothetical protein